MPTFKIHQNWQKHQVYSSWFLQFENSAIIDSVEFAIAHDRVAPTESIVPILCQIQSVSRPMEASEHCKAQIL